MESVLTYYLSPERSSPGLIHRESETISEHEVVSALLETVPGGALVLDSNRQIVAINKALCSSLHIEDPHECFGLRPGELLGCRIPSTAPGGCGTGRECRYCGFVNTVVKSLETGHTARGECRIARADGDAIDLAVAATPQKIDDSQFVFVGLHDISGAKRLEVLEQMFFHDILNTAGGVVGALLCLRDQANEEKHGNDLASLSYELAINLVDEIRAQRQLLAAEKGELKLEQQIIDTAHIVEETVALYRQHDVCRGRSLEVGICSSLTLMSDAGVLRRILGNMVKNALEATDEGQTVRIEVSESGEQAEFKVTNPGVMPPAVKLQVFQRSFSTKGAGRGVGTYSMKMLGERFLGGAVSFESREGLGTAFSFMLPLHGTESDSPRKDSFSRIEATTSISDSKLKQLHLLVVDDNKVNQIVAKKLLEKIGWTADLASDGEEALDLLQPHAHYDAILMDIHMPGMDGVEATRRIRSMGNNFACLPVIALTAASSQAETESCLDAGMNECLTKPFTPDEVKKSVLRNLED